MPSEHVSACGVVRAGFGYQVQLRSIEIKENMLQVKVIYHPWKSIVLSCCGAFLESDLLEVIRNKRWPVVIMAER